MAAADFKPDRLSVEELLTRRYYRIPRFQRPYSWDITNLEEFWRDVYDDNSDGYFIGPMVGWRRTAEASYASVVDGQQRLTTICLILAALRDAFKEYGADKFAAGIQGYLERQDRDADMHFVLQPEDDAAYLRLAVLAETPDRSLAPSSSNEQGLATAFKWASSKVSETLKALDPATKPIAVEALQRLRDATLSLTVIWIEHSNEDDAYTLFETLNSRGKDLDVADLLKNLLLSKIRSINPNSDAGKARWDRVRQTLSSGDTSIDADRFLLHWWLSTEEYVAARKLFQAMKRDIRNMSEATKRLESLEADAALYRVIQFPGSGRWTRDSQAIRDSLQGLVTFGVTQPDPLLLTLMRLHRDNKVAQKHIKPAFEAIERYHFQSTAIAAESSSGGVSAMYARFARELSRAATKEERRIKVSELRRVLSNRAPSEEQFNTGFTSLTFTNDYTREKRLIQYIFTRIHVSQFSVRLNAPTIEHLAPQSGDLQPVEYGNIGNLFLFDEALNQKLADKPFDQKKLILLSHRNGYDLDDVLAADTWGPVEIQARARRLAKLARQTLWTL